MKAILFDLDGTLVEAKEWHYGALNKALNLFGYNISREEHLSIFDGLPTKEKLKILKETQGFPLFLFNVVSNLKQEFTFKAIEDNCCPLPNIIYTLGRLRQEGYVLGLCSNSIQKSIDLMLNRSEIYEYFDIILSNQDVSRPKPDPEIYLVAASRLGISPQECLVVEDNIKGVRAGRAAGMEVLQVASPKCVTFEYINTRLR